MEKYHPEEEQAEGKKPLLEAVPLCGRLKNDTRQDLLESSMIHLARTALPAKNNCVVDPLVVTLPVVITIFTHIVRSSVHFYKSMQNKTGVSSMIHSARPTVSPVANIVLA